MAVSAAATVMIAIIHKPPIILPISKPFSAYCQIPPNMATSIDIIIPIIFRRWRIKPIIPIPQIIPLPLIIPMVDIIVLSYNIMQGMQFYPQFTIWSGMVWFYLIPQSTSTLAGITLRLKGFAYGKIGWNNLTPQRGWNNLTPQRGWNNLTPQRFCLRQNRLVTPESFVPSVLLPAKLGTSREDLSPIMLDQILVVIPNLSCYTKS